MPSLSKSYFSTSGLKYPKKSAVFTIPSPLKSEDKHSSVGFVLKHDRNITKSSPRLVSVPISADPSLSKSYLLTSGLKYAKKSAVFTIPSSLKSASVQTSEEVLD